MTTQQTSKVLLTGRSGANYEYYVYPIGASFKDQPGNYAFARWTSSGWQILYVGQTSSLKSRLTVSHHALPCVRRHGGTHVLAHLSGGEQVRLAEERDLIGRYQPPCNG